MLGSAFLISANFFFFFSPARATHFLCCLAGFCFLTGCHMEASIQGQIAVPPHTNSLAFLFFCFFCAALACQQKWAGMDGSALRVRERVTERGGREVRTYRGTPLWDSSDCFSPRHPFFLPPFLCSAHLCLSAAICFRAQMRMFVVAETPALQT